MRDSITSMEMASIIALPICEVRRDLRNLGNQLNRAVDGGALMEAARILVIT
jgi:hypothetical protein